MLTATPTMATPSRTTGRSVSSSEFKLFQELVHRETGIFLSDAKKALLVGRLSGRLRALGLDSFKEYYRHVTEVDADEQVRMLDCITTNETRFFREPQQFEYLKERLIPQLKEDAAAGRRPKRIRVWSAASSTGEEAYSLAMMLRDELPVESGWTIEIFGSDISTRVLDKARAAVWFLDRSREIPAKYLKRYMLRGTGSSEGTMKAGPEIRSLVRFERINLIGDSYPVEGRFDMVFCRNVLIYFNAATKERVVNGLLAHLEANGQLFMGHAESMLGMAHRLRRVGPTVYEQLRVV
jgi:chemotaxis protein methyltransferase CheR